MRRICGALLLAASPTVLGALAAADPAVEPAPLAAEKSGPVEGLDAIVLTVRPDPTHCTGAALDVKRLPRVAIAADDKLIADFYAVPVPTGLDYSGTHKDAALQRFNQWVEDLKVHAAAANTHYTDILTRHDHAASVIAAARIAQLTRHFAGVLQHIEIPIDLRTGADAADKTDAFCSAIARVAEPLVLKANEAARACADHMTGVAPGWWSTICTP